MAKRQLSLLALNILATHLTSFLERLFEAEKDRALPIVVNISHQILTFLKARGLVSLRMPTFMPQDYTEHSAFIGRRTLEMAFLKHTYVC